MAAYKKALELEPKNEQAALGMGWAYFYLKHWDEAIAAFNKAMELEPTTAPEAYNGIAWAYFFKKDVAKAKEYWTRAQPRAAPTPGSRPTSSGSRRARRSSEARRRRRAPPPRRRTSGRTRARSARRS